MNRFSKFYLLLLLVFVGVFLIYPVVNAAGLVPCGRSQDDPSTPDVNETRPCTICDIFALISRIINFVLFTILPVVAALFYLIGGLMILLSRGDPGLIATGKNWFWNTTWGLVIIFGAWMITNTVLKSLVGDSDISNSWFRIECTTTVEGNPSPPTRYACNSLNQCVINPNGAYINDPTCGGKCVAISSPSLSPSPPSSSTPLACMYNGVNYATLNLCNGQQRPGGCGGSRCSQYVSSINRYANGAATVQLLKTIMVIESDCNMSAHTGSSYGLMQLQTATANQFKNRCGVTENITPAWLTNPANADKSICIAAAYINSIAAGTCGSQPRNIYAGYNAGSGNCAPSRDCANDKSCDGGVVKKWECPYDNQQHTICNTGMYETKQGATYVNYCLNNLGF